MSAPAPRETGRRLVHVATGLLGVLALFVPPATVSPVIAAFAAAALAGDAIHIRGGPGAALVQALGGPLYRPEEARRLSGGSFLAVGYLVTWLAFPAAVAAPAIVVTAVCDPAAAAVGSRWSGRPGHKSWIGSAAALVTAFAVLALWPARASLPAAALAACGAGAAERLPGTGIDNLAIPLVTASLLAALT